MPMLTPKSQGSANGIGCCLQKTSTISSFLHFPPAGQLLVLISLNKPFLNHDSSRTDLGSFSTEPNSHMTFPTAEAGLKPEVFSDTNELLYIYDLCLASEDMFIEH